MEADGNTSGSAGPVTQWQTVDYDMAHFNVTAATSYTMSFLGMNNTESVDANDTFNATAAHEDERDEELAKIEIAVQAVIFFLAVFGNGMVLLVLGLRRKKLSRMNMLIVHLSLADLFVAFFNVLPQLFWDITFRFQGGDFLCRSVKYFQVLAMYASPYVLVVTAVDRYLAICHPLTSHTWTPNRVHILVAIAWFLSSLFAIPQVFIFAYRETQDPGVYDCWGVFSPAWLLNFYLTWFFIAIYIIPFIILTFAYGRICYVVWSSMRSKEPSMKKEKSTECSENGKLLTSSFSTENVPKRAMNANPRAHVRGLSKAKVKTVKLTLTVVSCYLICWSPFFISLMWSAWDENAPFQGEAMVIFLLLASLNSCTNPWIYLAFSDNIVVYLTRCFGRGRLNRTTTFDSESRLKGSSVYTTEVTRLDRPSIANVMPLLDKENPTNCFQATGLA